MNIAIIGSGNVGGALALRWIRKGHSVLVGAQTPLSEKNMLLATKIGEERFTNIMKAVQQSDVVVIATPPTAVFEIIEQMGDTSGKTIIDATNSIGQRPEPYSTVYHCLADRTKAEVVKCFNSTGFENMLNPIYNGDPIDMFMAGDSTTGKEVATPIGIRLRFWFLC